MVKINHNIKNNIYVILLFIILLIFIITGMAVPI